MMLFWKFEFTKYEPQCKHLGLVEGHKVVEFSSQKAIQNVNCSLSPSVAQISMSFLSARTDAAPPPLLWVLSLLEIIHHFLFVGIKVLYKER